MNKVQEFLNENFGEVRVVEINNVLWFVAKDTCDILGTQTRDLKKILDEDEVDSIHITDKTGREQDMLCISESGLYSQVIKSRKPFAKEFKKWITGTVIPAIRKDGAYINGEENVDMNNEEQETEFVLKAINILQNKIERLQNENKEMKPKVDKWSKFLDSNGTYSFTEVSKLISTMTAEEKSDISISVIKLTEFLREKGILSKAKFPDKEKENGRIKKGSYKNLPNKEYEDYFNVTSIHIKDNLDKTQTKVKASGVEFIYDLIKKEYKAV